MSFNSDTSKQTQEVIFSIKANTQPAFTCSKLTIETVEQDVKYVRRHWRHSGVFIVDFEHISYLVLVFLFLPLNM